MTRKIFLSVTNVMQTGLLLLSMPAQADELESLNTLCERLAESVVSLEQAAGGSVGRDEAKARGKENMSIAPASHLSVTSFGDAQSNPAMRREPLSNRRPRWLSSLTSFPNDFEEDVNKDSADPAVLARATTLQRLGRTITFIKYFVLAVAATSLTTVYSLRKSEVRHPHIHRDCTPHESIDTREHRV